MLSYPLATYFRSLRIYKKPQIIFSKTVVVLVLTSLILGALSGAGQFVWQKPDWTKHNVILNDLISYEWPVYYGKGHFVEQTSLVYYIGYYLPAALIGKVTSYDFAQIALFLYTTLGLLLFGLLLKMKLKRNIIWIFPLIFLISGIDILGQFYTKNWLVGLLHLETYTPGLQYSSIMTILTWVPQHGLAAWIPVALFLNDKKSNITIFGPFVIALTFIWSPFVSIGLSIMWFQFVVLQAIRSYKFWLITSISIALSLIFLLYYKSQLPLGTSKPTIFLMTNNDYVGNIKNMCLFLGLDLFIFAPIIYFLWKFISWQDRILIVGSAIILVLMPQIAYGQNNDFVMRVSIPHLALLFILILSYLPHTVKLKSWQVGVIIYILILGMATPYYEILQLASPSHLGTNEKPIYNILESNKRYGVSHQQYMGLATKAFGKYIGNYEKYYKK
ncbi:MAG: hypothetical protein U0525_00350 [Patescibacteria group bacterium]